MSTLFIGPPGPVSGSPIQPSRSPKGSVGDGGFDRALTEAMAPSGDLRISAHASARMAQRGIHISPVEMERLRGAVDEAAAKGAKESLMVSDDKALVVNVPNRTVVTAMKREDADMRVFTNIDSAVIL